MLDKSSLILLAHSDSRTLMAFYALLDAEGYFVAPCFSDVDLFEYCTRYKPELVITSDPLSGDGDDPLLEGIKERSPRTRILLLPDGVRRAPAGLFDERGENEEMLRIVDALGVPRPPVHVNGH